MKKTYDLIIIGGGAGGFASAIKANEVNIKTLMVNEGLPLGGTCVNVGCVPSKKLQWVCYIKNLIENHEIKGLKVKIEKENFKEIIEEEMKLVENMRSRKYEYVLENLKNVDFVKGKAKFVSEKEVMVNGKVFRGKKFIIAVGSTVTKHRIKGLDKEGFITHVEALKMKRLPGRIAIIGGGPMGLEFSQIFKRFGADVTILESFDTLFPSGEKELILELEHLLKKEGINIIKSTNVFEIKREGNSKVLFYEKEGRIDSVKCDEIMLAAGKTPNTEYLNLQVAGVKVNKRRAIVVNDFFQTTNPDIYAVGDCIDKVLRLETTAAREGTLAVENAVLDKKKTINYLEIPYTIFTDPPLSGVGYTEKRFVEKYKVCSCRSFYLEDLPKGIISNKTKGLIKMIVDPETEIIKGIHVLGENSFELIYSASIIIKNNMTIDDLIDTLPVFPSFSESLKLVALSFKKDVSKLSCCI